MRMLLSATFAATLVLVSCGGSSQSSRESGRRVRASEFGERWPLTVQEGYVDCVPVDAAIFRSGGKTYALNGMASGKYADIDPIWNDNPDLDGLKMSIGPLLDAALEQV